MIVIIALLIAGSVWLALESSPEPRVQRLLGRTAPGSRDANRGSWRWMASGTAALAAWVLLGGALGAGAAVACLVVIPPALARLESRATRERREQLERQAPLLADLLSATFTAGASVRDALASAGAAVGAPTVTALSPVVAALDLGADPESAWKSAGIAEAHRSIADALARAHRSGAPASTLLARAAEDLRRERRRVLEVSARSAGVRAVAPLAVCFLPAFVLLGVVPVVASLADGLLPG